MTPEETELFRMMSEELTHLRTEVSRLCANLRREAFMIEDYMRENPGPAPGKIGDVLMTDEIWLVNDKADGSGERWGCTSTSDGTPSWSLWPRIFNHRDRAEGTARALGGHAIPLYLGTPPPAPEPQAPAREPVAWRYRPNTGHRWRSTTVRENMEKHAEDGCQVEALYLGPLDPPPQQAPTDTRIERVRDVLSHWLPGPPGKDPTHVLKAELLRVIGDPPSTPEPEAPAEPFELLTKIRKQGWTVSIHNDYRLDGEAYTYWMFTNSAWQSVQGEGRTDQAALVEVWEKIKQTVNPEASDE